MQIPAITIGKISYSVFYESNMFPVYLTLIQPGKGRFTLAYMSHDYLHGSHAGLPGWIRVKTDPDL